MDETILAVPERSPFGHKELLTFDIFPRESMPTQRQGLEDGFTNREEHFTDNSQWRVNQKDAVFVTFYKETWIYYHLYTSV